MPSRDLYALKGLGPLGQGPYGPLRAYKSLEGIRHITLEGIQGQRIFESLGYGKWTFLERFLRVWTS